MDVRVGGSRIVCMEVQVPSGPMQMWFAGKYLEVVESKRLVYTEFVSDENGVLRSPADARMPVGHPTTTEVRVDLDADGAGTRMVLTHTGIPEGSPGAAGWRMAIDKLTNYLKARQ
jgi:uncharacterized protein YndB with AHSA1/START domain